MKAGRWLGSHCDSVARMRVVEMGRKRCGRVKICFGGRAIRLTDASDVCVGGGVVRERGSKDISTRPHPSSLPVPLL